jgi:sortase (surface protein transpeptidase)
MRLAKPVLVLMASVGMVVGGAVLLGGVGSSSNAPTVAEFGTSDTNLETCVDPSQPSPDSRVSATGAPERVANERPVRVNIPSLGVEAEVVTVVSNIGAVQVPDDIEKVGWYGFGAYPTSDAGSVTLVGHRDGSFGREGSFYDLGEIKSGEKITIDSDRGNAFDYEVVALDLVSKKDFSQNASQFFTSTGPHRLYLITCGGAYVKDKGGYQDNIIVVAERIASRDPAAPAIEKGVRTKSP